MAKFFTSPAALSKWVTDNNSNPTEAATRIINIIQDGKHEQDINESCRRIMEGTDEGASTVLHNLLSRYEITEQVVASVNEKMMKVYAANELFKNKNVTAATRDKMVKEAQIMRQPGQYEMPLRICPKLPKQSAGQGLISTYNCRHYCIDSIVMDDNPMRVICAEALWRRHVMDKFSREWQDPKTGKLIGGYINQRFHVFPDAGTPANPDVARDHGNNMSLAPNERSRKARPHEYSIERRMQEAREKGSTESIVLASVPSDKRITLTASKQNDDSEIFAVYSKAIDLHNKKISASDAAIMLKDEFSLPIGTVVKIQSMALNKMASHQSDVYVTAMCYNEECPYCGGNGRVVGETSGTGKGAKVRYKCTECDETYEEVEGGGYRADSTPAITEQESPDDIHEAAEETGLTEKKVVKCKACGKDKPDGSCQVCNK